MKLNIRKNNKEKVIEIEPITITMTMTREDFESTFGRNPKSQEEFQQFTDLCQVGIENQLDWDRAKGSARTFMEYRSK